MDDINTYLSFSSEREGKGKVIYGTFSSKLIFEDFSNIFLKTNNKRPITNEWSDRTKE